MRSIHCRKDRIMALGQAASFNESYVVASCNDEEAVLKAAGNGNIEKLEELKEKGTNFRVTDAKFRTAIHKAVNCHFLTIKYLVEEIELNPNLPDALGSRPLQWAADSGKIEIMSYLLDRCGSCSNDRDMFGDSAVQYAAYNGHMEAVKLLVEQHNADVTFVNQRGATAADDAEVRGHPELAAYLRECALKQRYILLKDCPQEGTFSKFKAQILKGEILSLNRNHKLVINNKERQAVVHVKCNEGDYSSLSPQAADLLLAISNNQQRYSLFMDNKTLLHKAMNFSLGDSVTLTVASTSEVKGIIKYRGPLKKCEGVFFGIQLQDPILKGTDGSYKGIQLFTCPPNCGLFISVDHIVL